MLRPRPNWPYGKCSSTRFPPKPFPDAEKALFVRHAYTFKDEKVWKFTFLRTKKCIDLYCCPVKVFSDKEIDGYGFGTRVSAVSAGKIKTGPLDSCHPRVAPVSVGKTKTGKTPCAGCKMSLASHGRCIRLKIPRASSGVFRRIHHPPIGFCIQHKAINKKNKPCPLRQETLPLCQESPPPQQETLPP